MGIQNMRAHLSQREGKKKKKKNVEQYHQWDQEQNKKTKSALKSACMPCARPHPLLHFSDLGGPEFFKIMASVGVLVLPVANEIGPRGIVWKSLDGSLDVTPAVRGGCRFLPSSSIPKKKKKKNFRRQGKQVNPKITHKHI
jgi:hypothetical protein